MSVHSCALLEAALRGEERAIKNGSHCEHSTYDGTCSVGVVRTEQDFRNKNVKVAYDVKK